MYVRAVYVPMSDDNARAARQCRKLHSAIGASNQAGCEYVNLIMENVWEENQKARGEVNLRGVSRYFISWLNEFLIRILHIKKL